jgi:hypothetical protein
MTTKLELTQQLAAVITERDTALSQLSALRVQLQAERTVGRNNTKGITLYSALLDECKRRNQAGEDCVVSGYRVVLRSELHAHSSH